jgi:hypothetical protein
MVLVFSTTLEVKHTIQCYLYVFLHSNFHKIYQNTQSSFSNDKNTSRNFFLQQRQELLKKFLPSGMTRTCQEISSFSNDKKSSRNFFLQQWQELLKKFLPSAITRTPQETSSFSNDKNSSRNFFLPQWQELPKKLLPSTMTRTPQEIYLERYIECKKWE